MAHSLACGITILGTDQAIHPARLAREAGERGFCSFYVGGQLRLRDKPATTNPEHLASDIRRLIGNQIQHGIGYVCGLP